MIIRYKKNKILVVNFNGRSYGDSPKYIIDKLKDKNVKIIWSVSKKYNDIPSNIKQVKYQSIRWIYELVTSKVWINNCRFPSYVRKRKNQVYIQTWHGCIAIKKIEFDVLDKLNKTYIDCMVNDKTWTGDAFTRVTFVDSDSIEPFFTKCGFRKISIFGQEDVTARSLQVLESAPDKIRDFYLDLSLRLCEKPKYWTYSSHLMYVGEKC